MGVMFFQNGSAIGTSAGWGGYTGNNNYVVRYDFTTGAEGASQVAIALNNIWYGHGAGTQSFGFRISSGANDWCNGRSLTPHSNTASMVYSSSTGYGCTLWAQGLNLLPNTTYYIFVYIVSSGAEYYTGWNCLSPQIVTAGSYTAPGSTLSSVSANVTTGEAVSVIMNRSGSNYHKATFSTGGTVLAVSGAFASSLSYTCPRAWLAVNTAVKSITVNLSVQCYSDAQCTNAVGSPLTGSFTLTADRDMHPVFTANAVSVSAVNSNSLVSQFVAGVSAARVVFNTALIDMSACAGAGISTYKVSTGGAASVSQSNSLTTGVIGSDGVIICAVTDSRGNEYSVTITVNLQPYVPPSLGDLGVKRCDSDGTDNQSGAYYKVKCSPLCTALTGNTCTVKVSIQPAGGSRGADVTLSALESGVWSDEWTSPLILGGTLSGDSFTVRFVVSDSVGGSSTYTMPLFRQSWAMKFNSGGTAVAFGMSPTVQNALQLPDYWRLYAGIPVLSAAAYGVDSPENAVSSPVEGQIYLKTGTGGRLYCYTGGEWK